MEKLRLWGESISLPVETQLWQQILINREAQYLLENNSSPKVTLIGTDPELSLANVILSTHPQAEIRVFDKNPEILSKAWQHDFAHRLTIQQADILNLDPYLIKNHSQDLVIAKHLIHFIKPPAALVIRIAPLLKAGGLFFASVPPFFDHLVYHHLKLSQSEFEANGMTLMSKQSLGKFLQGTVFGFLKGAPSPSVHLPQGKTRRVLAFSS